MLFLFVESFLVSLAQLVLALNSINNLLLQHSSTLIELCVYLFVLSYWQTNEKVARLFRHELIIAFCLIWLLLKLFIEDFQLFDNYSSGLAYIVTLSAASYSMFILTNGSSYRSWLDYRFWVLSATLIYSISSALVLSSGNLILKLQHEEILFLWSIHGIVLTFANIFYSVAFLLNQSNITLLETQGGASHRPFHNIALWLNRRSASRRESDHYGVAQSTPRPRS